MKWSKVTEPKYEMASELGRTTATDYKYVESGHNILQSL